MTPEALNLVSTIELRGGRFSIEDERLVIEPASAGLPYLDILRVQKPAILDLLRIRRLDCIPASGLEEWRAPFALWVKEACTSLPRWFGGLNPMHLKFCEWEADRDGVPCNRATFVRLMEESGFLVAEVKGSMLVSGLALQEDVAAFAPLTLKNLSPERDLPTRRLSARPST